jgi:hypothetical protein
MKPKTFFIGLVGFFLTVSCEVEPPILAAETREGLGTFGCLVNGELATAQNRSGTKWNVSSTYHLTANQFRLSATIREEHRFDFYVSQPKLGTSVIDSVFFSPQEKPYYYAARNVQQISFTKFDSISSGTFSFEANAYDRVTHEIVPNLRLSVNKGRFDVTVSHRN